MNQKICNIRYVLICGVYVTWSMQFKPYQFPAGVSRNMVVDALLHCALFHFMAGLKAAQIPYSKIQELIHYEFELEHNAAETYKNMIFAPQTSKYQRIAKLLTYLSKIIN